MLLRVVGSSCAKFETGKTFSCLQTNEPISNIVGPTVLGVVGSVCTKLKIYKHSEQVAVANEFLLEFSWEN